MLDNTELSQAIETLAAETEANAISPAYLAAVLRKISDLISSAYSSATDLTDNAQTAADDAGESARAAQNTANAAVAMLPTCTLAELDALCTYDVIKGANRATYFVTYMYSGTTPLLIGRCELFSDTMHHQVTQVLTTHCTLKDDGTINEGTHTDSVIYTYYRSYGLVSGRANYQTWSAWKRVDYAILNAVTAETTARTQSDTELKNTLSNLTETLGAAVYTGTLGGRNVTYYAGRKIADLGSVAGSSVAENWAKQAEVASSDVRLIFYEDTTKNQSGIIMQVKTTTTGAVRQELFLGETHYIRNVFGTNTETTTADSWKKTGVVSIAFTAASRLLALNNNDSKLISSVTLPLATTSAAGLMGSADKTKVEAAAIALTGIHFLGYFTSFAAAYAAAAEINVCAPFNGYIQLNFVVNSEGKEEFPLNYADGSIYGSGYIYQHFYKDNTTEGWKVWQTMPCDGVSGKRYRRVIILTEPQTTVESLGSWEEY